MFYSMHVFSTLCRNSEVTPLFSPFLCKKYQQNQNGFHLEHRWMAWIRGDFNLSVAARAAKLLEVLRRCTHGGRIARIARGPVLTTLFSGKLIDVYCKFLLVAFGVEFLGGIGPFIPLAVSLLEQLLNTKHQQAVQNHANGLTKGSAIRLECVPCVRWVNSLHF